MARRHYALLAGIFLSSSLAADDAGSYRRDVLPILAGNCYACHGPDATARKAGLRFDTPEGATAPLAGGERVAIAPGRPEASEMLRRVSAADPAEVMPPPEHGSRLAEKDVAILRRWIAGGARYERHWSFVAPAPPALPAVRARTWPRDSLDTFVLHALETNDLAPSAEEDRRVLARRVALDLTGLPPAPEDGDLLARDPAPDAYERYVDRLLASPAFGERWGRVWLDLARYADSAGYAQDPERTIWLYRDWVIRALNENMPFDRFTVEQLAGDLLPEPAHETLIATAFHRNTMTNSEGGTDDEEFRNAAVVDRVNTTFEVWMGLTMGCAQCHTHKYDPISQEEYFRVFAIFNNTEDADRGDETPVLHTLREEDRARRAELTAEIARLRARVEAGAAAELAEEEKRLAALEKELGEVHGVPTPVLRELPADKQRTTRIQMRGNFRVTGDEVEPGLPAAFHALPGGAAADRLSLARWIIDEENPLTARVTVNRHWEEIFGRGLVETSEDFGVQGEPPSHPALLDLLALRLVRSGWDLKRLLREIVTSATYRQTSRLSQELAQEDPENLLLARGPRFRLPAEMIRDQALAVAGLLSPKMYGPSVRPPQPSLGINAAFGDSTDWETSPGDDRYRRGLYTRWRRTSPYPSMITFDAPSREFCTVRRLRTNTPLQALVTLNDPVYVEAAQGLARRITREGGATVAERARHGFRLCLTRDPSGEELAQLERLHAGALARVRADAEGALALATDPLGAAPAGADLAELAAWTVVANVLMNLDEFLARR